MKENTFTKKQLRKTYSYRQYRKKLIRYSLLGLLLCTPYLVAIIGVLEEDRQTDVSPLVILETFMVIFSIGLIIYHSCNLIKLAVYPTTYIKYTGSVVDYEMESRSRGRYGSTLVIIFKIALVTEKGVNLVKSYEFPTADKICKPEKIKGLSFNIGYDETHDRLCMCDDVDYILCKEGIIDDPTFEM